MTNNSGFVPLKPSTLPRPASGGFVPKVLPTPSADTAPGGAAISAPHGSHGEPAVELRREGDRVTGITIRCGCGEVIELQCSY